MIKINKYLNDKFDYEYYITDEHNNKIKITGYEYSNYINPKLRRISYK